MTTMSKSAAWYKQPWLLFLLGMLAFGVSGGTTLLIVSINYQDPVLSDDYYDVGKGINQSLARERLAEQLKLVADIRIDSTTGEVDMRLSGMSLPSQLTLNVISPTQPNKDRTIRMAQSPSEPSRYVGQLLDEITGRRFVELLGEEGGQQWRLFDEFHLAAEQQLVLTAEF
ncbi:FixH family protein [Atopomonas sediminilitoris]|uniref:FixH family protein n=1 Tax=Atopomonas sediminilitoris TaxID=2919919 RepID=UPI001F4F0C0F|nr:FixH family protein [Atopomonas sediminilitoris]MCJ8169180.1 FixH family protein [Atopomonas sediminilitoris]